MVAPSPRPATAGIAYRRATAGRPRRVRRDLARLDQRLHAPPEPARHPGRPRARSSASTPTSRRPIPDGLRRRRAGGRRRAAGRRRVRGVRPARGRCGSSRCCSSCPDVQAAGLGRALLAKVMPPRRDRGARRRARTAPSRSRTGCTRRSGWCRGCRSSGSSAWPSATATCRRCRAGSEAVRFDESRRRGGRPPRRRARSRSIGTTAGLRAPPGPRLRAGARAGPAFLFVDGERRGGRLRLRRRRRAGSGRSPCATRRCSRRCSATSCGGRARAARSASGCRAPPARR